MKKVVILGAGFIGSTVAEDLSDDYSLTVADVDSNRFKNLPNKKNKRNNLLLNLNQ